MDAYTRLTKAWLENRYRDAFDSQTPNVYYGHEPIYGLGNSHCEPNHARRVVRLFQLLRRVRAAGGRTLLDVGGSEGYFAQLCRELFGMTVVSVDISEEACRRAAEIFAIPGCSVDAASLPFASGSFDVVTCAEVVEHLAEPVPAILELQRVARGTLVLGTEEWVPDAAERDRELAERHAEPHGERSIFADADLRVLFSPYETTFERQVLPDLSRFGDDRNIDRAALRALLLDLGAGRTANAKLMGIVLNASKAKDRGRTPRVPSDAEIADHLLTRAGSLHLIGAPTPVIPFPDGLALRCVLCGASLTPARDGLACRCGQRFARRRGVLAFATDLPPFERRIDAMLAERGGPAYPEQRRDLLALAQKLELPFEVRTSWSFEDPDEAKAWHWNKVCEVSAPGRVRVVDLDPCVQMNTVGCDPEQAQIVTVEMAIRRDDATATHDVAEVYWHVDGQLNFTPQCSAGVIVVPDGKMRTYRFEAPACMRGEVLIALRLDPISFGRGEVHLRSIRLEQRRDDG